MSDAPKHVCDITLPNGEELEIWRMSNGCLVGIDCLYIEDVSEEVCDPYTGEPVDLSEDSDSRVPVYDVSSSD